MDSGIDFTLFKEFFFFFFSKDSILVKVYYRLEAKAVNGGEGSRGTTMGLSEKVKIGRKRFSHHWGKVKSEIIRKAAPGTCTQEQRCSEAKKLPDQIKSRLQIERKERA